jgi:WD40 repeat protein
MSDRPSHNLDGLDIEMARRIDEVCRRFEADWRAGHQPCVEAYFGEFVGDARASLAAELETLQSELQQAAGQFGIADGPTIAPGSLPTPPKPGESPSSVLDAATLAPPGDATVDLGSSAPTLSAAGTPSHVRYFGDYEIIREIARGGMGVVFEARQVSLNRKVALKMILAGQLAHETDVKRFYSEAEAAANLDHPGIVPIFEVGQHEGQHYFSMGFVEGQSLTQRLAEGPLRSGEAAALMVRVAEAIEYAHQRGVIHRDLKPANILLDQNGNPRVTDFGLAKRTQTDSGLTGSGQIMGTPSYMPSEQAGGQRSEVGPAADVYALGATLYALVTGRPPFQSATAMDTVIQVVSDEPVPPRRLNATIPRDLETICLKCLEKAPKRRYGSARELADELERFLDCRPIQARPITARERAVKWARRQPIIAGLSAAVVLVSLIGLSGILLQWRSAVIAQRESARLATHLVLQRAVDRCTNDDPNEGLLWLARGLELATDEPLRQWFGLSLDAWSRQVTVLERVLPPGSKAADIAFHPDGRGVVRSEGQAARIWDLETSRPIGPLLAHGGFISHAAFSSDGRTLVTAAQDGTARVWDAKTGTLQGEPLDHLGWPTALALAPTGRYLALAAVTAVDPQQTKPPNAACHIWDLAARRKVAIEPPPREKKARWELPIQRLAFDHRGSTLAVALGDRVLRWDVASERFMPPSIEGRFLAFSEAMAFLPDGELLIATLDKRIVRVDITASGNLQQSDQELPFRARTLSVDATKTNTWLLAGLEDQSARLMRLKRGGQEGSFRIIPDSGAALLWHPQPVIRTALAPDGRILLTSASTARQWHRAPGQELGPPVPDPEMAQGARTWSSDDGRRVLVGGRDGGYRLLDGATGYPVGGTLPIPPPDNPSEIPLVVAFSPDGRRMVTIWTRSKADPQPGSPEVRRILGRELRAWDAETGESTGPPVSIELWGNELSFSPDGRRLWPEGLVPDTSILDATTLQSDALWSQIRSRARGPVVGVSLSPDGRWLLTLSKSNSSLPTSQGADACQLWDTATGRAMGEFSSPDSAIEGVIFSPNGRRLATSHSRVTRLWDLPSCHPIETAIEVSVRARKEFSADGSILLSRDSKHARLWDASSGRAIGEPVELKRLGSIAPRDSAVLSPDGRLLAIGTGDGYAQLIDAHTGRPTTSQLPHKAEVVALAFSPDSTLLLTGSADGTARFWHVATGRPIGPPLDHPGHRVDRVAFTPGGRSVVTWSRVSDSCTIVRHWAAPKAWTGDAAAIRGRVERMTNRRLDLSDVPRALTAEEWHARGDR